VIPFRQAEVTTSRAHLLALTSAVGCSPQILVCICTREVPHGICKKYDIWSLTTPDKRQIISDSPAPLRLILEPQTLANTNRFDLLNPLTPILEICDAHNSEISARFQNAHTVFKISPSPTVSICGRILREHLPTGKWSFERGIGIA
jgi:hypothetical protein